MINPLHVNGAHFHVYTSTSWLLSKIKSQMSKALLQTEQAPNDLMVIFPATSMGVNSAEEISPEFDLGCHILYLNKNLLTFWLSLWEWCRDLNSLALYLRRTARDWPSVYGLQMDWFLTLCLFGGSGFCHLHLSVCLSFPIILVNKITQSVYPINLPNVQGGFDIIFLDGIANEPYWLKSSCSLRPTLTW